MSSLFEACTTGVTPFACSPAFDMPVIAVFKREICSGEVTISTRFVKWLIRRELIGDPSRSFQPNGHSKNERGCHCSSETVGCMGA